MFHIGDRVEFIGHLVLNGGRISIGKTGTVAAINHDSWLRIGVEWDEKIGTHDLGGKCKMGHGWWIAEDDLALCSEEPLEPASDAELMQFLFSE